MSTTMLAAPEAKRWQHALARNKQRLDDVLRGLNEGEWDWAPDDGIASPREHLWAIVKSERLLVARLLRGEESVDSYGAQEVAWEAMGRILDICHRRLEGWLAQGDQIALDDEARDMLLSHLDLKSHHTAAMALLSQLIDPARAAALPL